MVCPNCGEHDHRKSSWRCPLTRTRKRKRTKKSAPKPGRKKSKKSYPTPSGANTPRTRVAVAREKAAMAAMEAEQAAETDVPPIEVEAPEISSTPHKAKR